jgi:hypothetical protein
MATVREVVAEILDVQSSYLGDAIMLVVRIRVPPTDDPGQAVISVRHRFPREHTVAKSVQAMLTYFKPLPVLSSTRWCSICPHETPCIVQGVCAADGEPPLANLLPVTGGGVIEVLVINPPRDFKFMLRDGSTLATVSLALGSIRMQLRRVVYGDGVKSGDQVVQSERIRLER